MNKLSYYQNNKEKCLEAQRRYRSKPKVRKRYLEQARVSSKNWYAIESNREKRYQYNKKAWLKRVKELEEIAGRPRPENCEICNNTGKIEFDHDHKTGKFRGWICMKCNTVLGKVNDDIKILQIMISYLDKCKVTKV